MPATAGRVRMPANNRVHSSAALQTHGIWQSTIGYDPYAPSKDDSKNASQEKSSTAEPEGENAYANFQGLLALARITSSNTDEARGSCKKSGRVGHLSFQCRNFLSIKEGDKEKDPEAVQAAVLSGLEKIKGNGRRVVESEETEDDDGETETSDSEVDSEIEGIIAERYGKKSGDKGKSSRKKEDPDEDRSDSDVVDRKKRGRSKKRSSKKRESSDSEDEGGRKRRKEKRRKRGEMKRRNDNAVSGRVGRKRGGGGVIDILIILIQMGLRILVDGTIGRTRRDLLHQILMSLAPMIHELEEKPSVQRRRAGNVVTMMSDVMDLVMEGLWKSRMSLVFSAQGSCSGQIGYNL